MVVDFEYGENAASTSFNKNIQEELSRAHFGEREWLVSDSRGFDSVTNKMMAKLNASKVHLSQIVRSIDATEGGIAITTNSGRIYKSRTVLITASIGVLQSGSIEFKPPLPAWKTKAIANAKMTSYVKVFLNWEKRWWDDLATDPTSPMPRHLYTVFLDEEDEGGTWRLMNELRPLGKRPLGHDPTSCTLVFTTVGEEGRRVQNLTNFEIQNEIMRKLRRAWPLLDVPEPTAIYVPRWDLDPLFMGAFSVEPSRPDFSSEDLSSPIKRKGCGSLHFAGEAMHSKYKAYLQAAYFSGTEEAHRIADALQTGAVEFH